MFQALRVIRKRDFHSLEQGNMIVSNYKAKFHALSRFDAQLLNIEEKCIHHFVKGLNTNLQISALQITFLGNTFNEVVHFVKKVEKVKKDRYAKMTRKGPKFRQLLWIILQRPQILVLLYTSYAFSLASFYRGPKGSLRSLSVWVVKRLYTVLFIDLYWIEHALPMVRVAISRETFLMLTVRFLGLAVVQSFGFDW